MSASAAALAIAGCSPSHSSSTSPDNDAAIPCGPMDEGDCTIGPDYADAPELTVQPGVPRGMIAHFTMPSSSSQVFPGVAGAYTRDVWVYVPSQYVDGSAAPMMVVQDGGTYKDRLTAALDTMIDAKRLPVLVAVMVDPGAGSGERSHEYDAVSTDYTSFIETEVLPRIPANADIVARYKALKLTTDPDGRASMGGSSGGAAAFTMGWLRPDLYHRVFTYSGSFVNLAYPPAAAYPDGAHEYPGHLVADTPVKPLRVFLEVGEKDLTIGVDQAFSWLVANQAMAAALKTQGYHYRFDYALGAGHVDPAMVGQTLPDALAWVWSGYPIP
jgi:enterochelin esterase family protein